MRTLLRNKRYIRYANVKCKVPKYKTDANGDILYTKSLDGKTQVPVTTGQQEYRYTEPVEILGNIYDTGGSVEMQPYGHDYETFGGMLVYLANEFPITDESLIWEDSPVKYLATHVADDGTISEDIIYTPDPASADWRVRRATTNINEARATLERITR